MTSPVLDKKFYPMLAALADHKNFLKGKETVCTTLVVERDGGYNHLYSLDVTAEESEFSYRIAERIAKTMLWVCGGFRIGVHGAGWLLKRLQADYSPSGARAFDADFMAGVYERPFEVVELGSIPPEKRASVQVGGHLEGCRIGFDAGGSDRKVSAVIDGVPVYSEEVVWSPKTETDPHYHYREILTAMRTAASKMPRVDCIGVSSAGVYINNKIMVASLFLKVDKKVYGDYVKNMYINIAADMGVPVEVANDGDVTALAGSMELGEGRVLGIAMGTSEAAGYINSAGGLNGWLSELAFAPVDFREDAMRDEWSGDSGVGCKYFSQDAVIKLAEYGGLTFREGTPAQKLKIVQALAEQGDPLALQIFDDIGVYLAHTLPFYALFYDIRHVLLLGRVMSGRGGDAVLAACRRVLQSDYPNFRATIDTPDEKSRRVGQSVAAASLCALK